MSKEDIAIKKMMKNVAEKITQKDAENKMTMREILKALENELMEYGAAIDPEEADGYAFAIYEKYWDRNGKRNNKKVSSMHIASELLKVAKLLMASMSRHCSYYKASNGKWYMNLAPDEHGEYHESYAYGPFGSQEEVEKFLDRFTNPGGMTIDDSGTKHPPKISPNGNKIISPSKWR